MQLDAYIRDNTTVTEFARRIGRSRAQVHRYMRGENLTLSIIEEISRATGGQVTPAELFALSREASAA